MVLKIRGKLLVLSSFHGICLSILSDEGLLDNQPHWYPLREGSSILGSDNSLSTTDSPGSGHKSKKRPFSRPSMEDVHEASPRRGQRMNAVSHQVYYLGLVVYLPLQAPPTYHLVHLLISIPFSLSLALHIIFILTF